MFRARLASVVVAASLAASGGCQLFSHPWFGNGCCPCEGCCPSPCDSCTSAGCSPIDGPILTPPPIGAENGHLPLAPPPRLAPSPQSTPIPYTP
jgi:hypothetical protein